MVEQPNNESPDAVSIQPIKEGAAKSELDKDELARAIPREEQSLQPRKEDLADVEPGQPARKNERNDAEPSQPSVRDDLD